jgi:hypothetical protein
LFRISDHEIERIRNLLFLLRLADLPTIDHISLQKDAMAYQILPKQFLGHFKVAYVPPDSDCWYSSVALLILGHISYASIIRFCTLYIAAKYRYIFEPMLENRLQEDRAIGSSETPKTYEHFLLSIGTSNRLRSFTKSWYPDVYTPTFNWALEITLLATAIAINRPIYLYREIGYKMSYDISNLHVSVFEISFNNGNITGPSIISAHSSHEYNTPIRIFNHENHFSPVIKTNNSPYNFKPFYRNYNDYLDLGEEDIYHTLID